MNSDIRKRAALKDILSWPKFELDARLLPGTIAAHGGYFFNKPFEVLGIGTLQAYPAFFDIVDRRNLISNETRIRLLECLERERHRSRMRQFRAMLKAQGGSPPAPAGDPPVSPTPGSQA